jgi:hypothetical protein
VEGRGGASRSSASDIRNLKKRGCRTVDGLPLLLMLLLLLLPAVHVVWQASICLLYRSSPVRSVGGVSDERRSDPCSGRCTPTESWISLPPCRRKSRTGARHARACARAFRLQVASRRRSFGGQSNRGLDVRMDGEAD